MCRCTALGTGRETLLSERQEANCRDRRLLQYSRLAGKLGELAMDQPFVGQAGACFIWSDELVIYLAPVGKAEEA